MGTGDPYNLPDSDFSDSSAALDFSNLLVASRQRISECQRSSRNRIADALTALLRAIKSPTWLLSSAFVALYASSSCLRALY